MTVNTSQFKFNGILLALQPSSFRWVARDPVGINGSGHPIYPTIREFEMTWETISVLEYQDLIDLFDNVGTTGTCVVEIPTYGAVIPFYPYAFQEYSGCTINEPSNEGYFETYIRNAKLLITNIRIT